MASEDRKPVQFYPPRSLAERLEQDADKEHRSTAGHILAIVEEHYSRLDAASPTRTRKQPAQAA